MGSPESMKPDRVPWSAELPQVSPRSFLGSGRGSLAMRANSAVRVCPGTLRHVVRMCVDRLLSRPTRSVSQYLQVHQ